MSKRNNTGEQPKKNYRARKELHRRVIFGIVATVLSLGLLGSSIAWLPSLFSDNENNAAQDIPAQLTPTEIEEKIKSNPKDIDLLFQLGQAYLRENNSSKAIETYQKAVNLAPERDDLKNRLAEGYIVGSRYDEAIKILEEVISKNPNDKDAHYNMGHALIGKREYAKAQGEFEKYIQLNGENNPGSEEVKRLIETLKGLQ